MAIFTQVPPLLTQALAPLFSTRSALPPPRASLSHCQPRPSHGQGRSKPCSQIIDWHLAESVERVKRFLKANAGRLKSVTNTNVTIEENFAQLLVLEVTGDASLPDVRRPPRLYNFFKGSGELTTTEFPCDMDTTSVGLSVLGHPNPQVLHAILDEMRENCDENRVVHVYFDPTRPRTDPVVCLNVLTFFHKHGRLHELKKTLGFAYETLLHRRYLRGTRYYHTPEAFLYFAYRFVAQVCSSQGSPGNNYGYGLNTKVNGDDSSDGEGDSDGGSIDGDVDKDPDAEVEISWSVWKWVPLLRTRLMELRLTNVAALPASSDVNTSGTNTTPVPDALALAMRVYLSVRLGLEPDPAEMRLLLEMQRADGGWGGGCGWFYKYGSSGVLIENAGFTSAVAWKALEGVLDRDSLSLTML